MPPTLYTTTFVALRDTDLVSDATRRMLDERVSDLPVVDGDGRLVGMFKLDRMLAALLPKAALVGFGMDLAFVGGDTMEQLRERMRDIESEPVRAFCVRADQVTHPGTSPVEVVLMMYRGTRDVPVVDPASGRLVGMVSPHDVLAALRGDGAA